MSRLTEYIEKIENYVSQHGNMTEIEIIRYVYLDLGKRFSFNEKFLPFGNSKEKKNMYRYRSSRLEDLEECMETNKAICKSISYILEYVLKSLGIDIKTVADSNNKRSFPHVYNIITLKSGESFSVDLQEDMYNIQSHSFTSARRCEITMHVLPRFIFGSCARQ